MRRRGRFPPTRCRRQASCRSLRSSRPQWGTLLLLACTTDTPGDPPPINETSGVADGGGGTPDGTTTGGGLDESGLDVTGADTGTSDGTTGDGNTCEMVRYECKGYAVAHYLEVGAQGGPTACPAGCNNPTIECYHPDETTVTEGTPGPLWAEIEVCGPYYGDGVPDDFKQEILEQCNQACENLATEPIGTGNPTTGLPPQLVLNGPNGPTTFSKQQQLCYIFGDENYVAPSGLGFDPHALCLGRDQENPTLVEPATYCNDEEKPLLKSEGVQRSRAGGAFRALGVRCSVFGRYALYRSYRQRVSRLRPLSSSSNSSSERDIPAPSPHSPFMRKSMCSSGHGASQVWSSPRA